MRSSTSKAGTTPRTPAPREAVEETGARVDGRDARWAEHRSSRRAELVRGARRAVHHLGPDLSMDELATEMGTSKSILYRYFTDKSGLQAAVGGAVIDDLREVIAEATAGLTRPREQIAAMIDVYLGVVESSAHVYAFVTQPEATATAGALRGFMAETEDMVADALLPVLRPGGHEDDGDRALAALWASGIVGLTRASAERWIAARGAQPARDADAPAAEAPRADAPSAGASAAHPPAERLHAADAPAVENVVAGLDRAALAGHLTDWLWQGAVGVARRTRRTRATRTQPTSEDSPRTRGER